MLSVQKVNDGGRMDGAGVKCTVILGVKWNEDPHRRRNFRWEIDIKMSLKGVIYKAVKLTHVVQDSNYGQVLMNAVMTL